VDIFKHTAKKKLEN